MLNAIRTILADKIYYCNELAIKIIEAGEDKGPEKYLKKHS